jgi:hypothetical protein
MSLFSAAGAHHGISAAIAGIIVALLLLVWYSGAHFRVMGGDVLRLLLVGCNVIIDRSSNSLSSGLASRD